VISHVASSLLCAAAFSVVLFGLGYPLVTSIVNPRRYILREAALFRRRGVILDMQLSSIDSWLVAGAFFVAGRSADLSAFWYLLAALFAFGGFFTVIVPWFSRRHHLPEPEHEPPIQEVEVKRRIKANHMVQLIQATLLGLWLYAWRDAVA